MANEYLKPQTPLKDLNSENYFYPLTTSDQVFLLDTTTRLSSLLDHTNFTASRAIYYNGTKLLSSNNIFLNDGQIGINRTSLDASYKFSVVGNSLFNGILYFANGTTYFLNNSADTTLRNITAYSSYTLNTSAITDSLAMKISTRAGTSSIGTNNYTSATITQNDWAQIYYRTPILRTIYETAGDTSSAVTSSHYFQPYWWFRQWSVNTSNGAKTSYHESYSLPATDHDRTSNASYKILTTKNLTDADSRFVTLSTDQTINGQKTFNTKIHSAVSASDIDMTRIPSDNEIALETGNGDGTVSAWIWREQYTPSNWGIFHDNSTDSLYFVGNNDIKMNLSLSSGRLQLHAPFNDSVGAYYCSDTRTDAGWHYPFLGLSPNIAAGGNIYICIGKATNTGNSAGLRFQWNGANSNSNLLGFEFYGRGTPFYVRNDGFTYFKGTLNVWPQTGSYTEGLRIHSYNSWATIMLLSNGGTGDSGVTTNDWGIFNNNGTLYINKGTSSGAGNPRAYANANGWYFGKAYGAVWNDYAEFRETKQEIEPGRCIIETGKGDLILSTKRLQEGCEIVSDTFGFAIGQSKQCNTPTAASGRVLAYPYEDKCLFKPGKPVCSGPNGTISIMTDEEARLYPWCIIGTVSEIPDYEEWQCGDEKTISLKVNGRIWIRIR